jgi:hypothetical protein
LVRVAGAAALPLSEEEIALIDAAFSLGHVLAGFPCCDGQ